MNKFLKGIGLIFKHGPAKVVDWYEQSIYDPLTGLYNRRFLIEAGKRELARAKRLNKPTSLIFIDVDKLKKINDQGGHAAGDKALRQIAALLKKVCREIDLVCRISGDEFVILLPETAMDDAMVVVHRLRVAIKDFKISLSYGIAEADSSNSLEELIIRADQKMYEDKGLKI